MRFIWLFLLLLSFFSFQTSWSWNTIRSYKTWNQLQDLSVLLRKVPTLEWALSVNPSHHESELCRELLEVQGESQWHHEPHYDLSQRRLPPPGADLSPPESHWCLLRFTRSTPAHYCSGEGGKQWAVVWISAVLDHPEFTSDPHLTPHSHTSPGSHDSLSFIEMRPRREAGRGEQFANMKMELWRDSSLI